MKSFAFPNFLTNTKVNIVEDKEATESNLRLLLLSQKNQLFGDPAFGSNLIKLLYEQNNKILIDIAIDYIYEAIHTFIPQLYVDRNDIEITQDKGTLYAKFLGVNKLTYESNLYEISLIENESESN